MSVIEDEAAENDQPVWNGVDADFYIPEEQRRGWFGPRRSARRAR